MTTSRYDKYIIPVGNYDYVNIVESLTRELGEDIGNLALLNISQLPNTSTDGYTAFVHNYYSSGSGGGGAFVWSSSTPKTEHDGGYIIDPEATGSYSSTNEGNGCWIRLTSSEKINVKDYGAKGDGSTDDSAAIQAALDAHSSGVIYFPNSSGSYMLGSELTLYENQTIIGDGFKGGNSSSISTLPIFSDANMFKTSEHTTDTSTTTNVDHVSIQNLAFNITATNKNIFGMSIRFGFISNCRFESSGSGNTAIYIIGSDAEAALNTTITECYFTGGLDKFKHHIYLGDKTADTKYLNNYFEGSTHASIYSAGSVEILASNHFYHVGRAYFSADSADIIFSNNYVENTDSCAIFVLRGRTDLAEPHTSNLKIINNIFKSINNPAITTTPYPNPLGVVEFGASPTSVISGILFSNNSISGTGSTNYILYEHNGELNTIDNGTDTFAPTLVESVSAINNTYNSTVFGSIGFDNLATPIVNNIQGSVSTPGIIATASSTKLIVADEGIIFPKPNDNWYSVALGAYALANDTSDHGGNIAIGYEALKTTNHEWNQSNIAIGEYSLTAATSDGSDYYSSSNISIGTNTLEHMLGGSGNIAIGSFALHGSDSTELYNNIAIGYSALGEDGFTGSYNICLGRGVCEDMVTGSSNVVIGEQACSSKETGDRNVVIGANAIRASGNVSGTVAIGYDALRYVTGGTENTAVGYGALRNLETGDRNTAVGYEALYDDETANYSIAIGYQALFSTSGSFCNTAIGYQTLRNTTTGYHNTCVGANTGFYNNIGNNNTALGSDALNRNTASNNTAIGYRALKDNTTGTENTAVGVDSNTNNTSGNLNTSLGYEALFTNTTGDNNVAIGARSLYINNFGTHNTCVGYYAGYFITGSNNTILGRYTGNHAELDISTTGNNYIVLSDGEGNPRAYHDATDWTLKGNVNGRDLDADGTKLDGIEDNADVTDATNVDAAGAVMETDYNANTILAATVDNTPASLTIAEQTLVGRITAGNIDALTATEVRTLLNVEDGSTADQTPSEILTGLLTVDGTGTGLDADLLDGQEGTYYLNTSTTFSGDVSGTYNNIVVANDSHTHNNSYYTKAEVDELATAMAIVLS